MRAITPATGDHAPQIATVHVHSWQSAYREILEPDFLDKLSIDERTARWRGILERRESRTLVAEAGGRVEGFISFGDCRDDGAPKNQGEIWALYVSPSHWGQGVGHALMTEAVDLLKSAGKDTTSVWVLSGNERGLAFYRRFGFELEPSSGKVFELGGRQVEEVRLALRHAA